MPSYGRDHGRGRKRWDTAAFSRYCGSTVFDLVYYNYLPLTPQFHEPHPDFLVRTPNRSSTSTDSKLATPRAGTGGPPGGPVNRHGRARGAAIAVLDGDIQLHREAFANRRTCIEPEHVSIILKDDEYATVETAAAVMPGDLMV